MENQVQHKISAKLRKAIKTLAVSYEAYCSAHNEGNDNGIVVWGEKLLRHQAEFGLELVAPNTTQVLVNQAIRRQKEAGYVEKTAGEVVADFVRENSAYV